MIEETEDEVKESVLVINHKHEVVLDRMFAEDTWELAFGADAWAREINGDQVYGKLVEYEKKARAWDVMYKDLLPADGNYELREKMDNYLLATDPKNKKETDDG